MVELGTFWLSLVFWGRFVQIGWKINKLSRFGDLKTASMGAGHLNIYYVMSKAFSRHVRILTALRKHAYSNILKISPPKTENFQIKNSDIFHISAQNKDYGYSLEPPRRGGSNEYPQSMFLSIDKKIMYTPCKPLFYYIKVGFKGVKIIQAYFRDGKSQWFQ